MSLGGKILSNPSLGYEIILFFSVDCTHPGTIPNGVALGSILLSGSSLRYVCNPGFSIVGEKTITCQKGGSWDALPPRCISEGAY